LTLRPASLKVPLVPTGQRLLFLSHRPPVVIRRTMGGVRVGRTIGDLADAVDRVVQARGGTWETWSAGSSSSDPSPAPVDLGPPTRTVRLRDTVTFQAGFANQVLWPLCHVFPNRCSFQPGFWTAYRRANEAFAAAVRTGVEPGDLVWVNDFHLALVPGLLRAVGVPAQVGAFWHIPFPPPSVFGICPWRTDVLGGLLGADLIGFQTDGDASNFLDCVRHFLGLRVVENPPAVVLPGRDVRIVALAVGVNAARLREQAADAAVRAQANRLRDALGAEVVILGIDRLDYAKGINERLLGFERFLAQHPEWRRRVALVQIAVPNRFHVPGLSEMRRQVEESVGRILGRYTYDGRSPLAYLYTAFDHERLAAYYVAADVALVTPLRDGMNLVAKEYVACHSDGDGGVLLLSEFAGAALELREALLVNPYDPESIRRQLHTAVTMPERERRRRMRALASRVAARDVEWWASQFLALLGGVGARSAES
jgi:alpha,alpha-trehalose-phosphate synthase [UDP-forming]